MALNQGHFGNPMPLPKDAWQCLGLVLVVTTASGTWWGEARDAAKHSTNAQGSPHSKEPSYLKCPYGWNLRNPHPEEILS